uniref:Secreted protein n=1 Tax=Romanomermis culicivorax TaxID=13658 RepID=A0A915JIZ3_ROMCU
MTLDAPRMSACTLLITLATRSPFNFASSNNSLISDQLIWLAKALLTTRIARSTKSLFISINSARLLSTL